jgi:FAD/FMN-containing dehydrogenase
VGAGMKWKSKRHKEAELRAASWDALPSVDLLFSTKDAATLRELRTGKPPSLDQRFNNKDIQKLQLAIRGTIVLPTDLTYHRDRQMLLFSVQEFPQLIVFCEVFEDARRCLEFAHKYELRVSIRSGGHSTAGYSVNSGMLIDMSRIKHVVVDPKARRAIVGAGATIGDLNAALNIYSLHVPSGGCHDVCVAGYMQGGGYGFTTRKFGMNCDNVHEVLVMTADGKLVIANARQNPDLFWAIRGGTGGNFGILLQITYDLHELGDVWGFGLQWPIDSPQGIANAAAALVEMQANYMQSGAPRELGYMNFLSWQETTPCMVMRGMYLGPQQQGEAAIASLKNSAGCTFKDFGVGRYSDLDTRLIESPPGLPQVPDLAREEKQSGYIARKLGVKDWTHVINGFLQSPNRSSLVCMEPYGGRVSEISATFNAFIHRKVDMNLFLDVFWMSEGQERADSLAYLDQFVAMMEPHGNGETYQNYPRRTQLDYRRRYWGRSFEKLLAIKQKYDKHNFFRYGQSISPESAETTYSLPQLPEGIEIEPY